MSFPKGSMQPKSFQGGSTSKRFNAVEELPDRSITAEEPLVRLHKAEELSKKFGAADEFPY
jgi:hypothetical protein